MKHLCECGRIATVTEEGNIRIATCKHCGTYQIYSHEIIEPKEPKPAKRRAERR